MLYSYSACILAGSQALFALSPPRPGAGGEPLAQLLEGCGVDLRYLGRTETPQGHAIIQVQPDGQNCIFLYGGSNQAVTPEDIDAVLSHFAPGDYLLMQRPSS